VTSEVEQRIHRALGAHPLERLEEGYRLVHPGGVGVSTLRLVPVNPGDARAGAGAGAVTVAQVLAEYAPERVPAFHAAGVQRLNAMAVHGAYERGGDGVLRQTAQFSIHADEPGVHLAVQTVLNAFGGQFPIGLSVALATASGDALERQRAHHGMTREWRKPVEAGALSEATNLLRERGLAASHDQTAVWAELALSGDCPSRSIDPLAETAVLQVDTKVPHPIAGVGYLATISLPLAVAPEDAAEVCRRLNSVELAQVDFVPRLGAWGLHGPNAVVAYSCFMPDVEFSPSLPMSLMWWLTIRAAWLRDRFWKSGRGLTPDAFASLPQPV